MQTPEGLAPIGVALVADAVLRSVPGVGAIVALLTGNRVVQHSYCLMT